VNDESEPVDRLAELLLLLRGNGHGLPNLPLMNEQWVWSENDVPSSAVQWMPLVNADPSRWYLQVSDPTGFDFVYTTAPDDLMQVGTLVRGGYKEFKYKDCGPSMQADIYFFTKGGGNPLTVVQASIRLK
jgi:hypothetical protein